MKFLSFVPEPNSLTGTLYADNWYIVADPGKFHSVCSFQVLPRTHFCLDPMKFHKKMVCPLQIHLTIYQILKLLLCSC